MSTLPLGRVSLSALVDIRTGERLVRYKCALTYLKILASLSVPSFNVANQTWPPQLICQTFDFWCDVM